MADPKIDPAQVAGTLDWLEDDHRQLRAQVGQLAQEIEQLADSSREQALRQRSDSADIEGLRQNLHRIPQLEEAIRQAREDIGDIRTLVTQQAGAQERSERALSVEIERLRLQLAETSQRVARLAEELQPLPVRFQAISDHARRLQDQLTTVQQVADEVGERQSGLVGKIDLAVEQNHRLERTLATIEQQFAPLRREDEVLASRIQLAIDLARQNEQRMAAVLAEEQGRRDLAERIEILRTERNRIQQQLGDLEHAGSALLERTDELGRLLRQETDRRQALAGQISELEGRLIEQRRAWTESIIQIWQSAEEHKRQEVGTLQEQARSLQKTLHRLTRPSPENQESGL